MRDARGLRRSAGGAAMLGLLAVCGEARATNIFEYPGMGTQEVGRGGAWVARADNPIAAAVNPAGLVAQGSGFLLDVNVAMPKVCFDRQGPGSTTTLGVGYTQVCTKFAPTPEPFLAGAWRLSDRFALGLAIVPPAVYGRITFPETVRSTPDTNHGGHTYEIAPPQRYMLLDSDGLLLNPTLSVAYQAARGVRFGAGFIWGFGRVKLASTAMALAQNDQTRDDPTSDALAQVDVSDYFIPGIVLGTQIAPHDDVDLGASFRWQDAFDGHGDLTVKMPYWTASQGVAKSPTVTESSAIQADLAHFRLENPWELELGARFHLPRAAAKAPEFERRDLLRDDVFDVEVDLSYSHNSVHQKVALDFPQSPAIGIRSGTTELATVPRNGDVPVYIKGDTLGVRVGGDVVVLPGHMALRAGGWFEPDVQRPEYVNVTQIASRRIGAALGAQVRVGPVDVEAAYLHVWFDTVDNHGDGRARALNGNANAQPVPFRTPYAINGGVASEKVDIVSLGGTYRF